ncbi:MAG: saccharopine dehydrogenase C-terminal domain-containing protein [Anaerolineales bacterium]
MAFRYAVLGAGRQGVAAAYDLARFGDAEQVLLVDARAEAAEAGANRVNRLVGRDVAVGVQGDVAQPERLGRVVSGVDAAISAVPYRYNLGLTRLAIREGFHLCDLGGNTGVTLSQLALDEDARRAGVSIVPDCGMGPGLNVSLGVYAMSLLDEPQDLYIYDGGLPLHPVPPWNYVLTFNIGGLTNEYAGNAHFLRNGHVAEVPGLSEVEELDIPGVGTLEAAVTTGGLSTMAWTFEGKLRTLENKTLRYPGHWALMRAYAQLGLLDLEPIRVGEVTVVPREVFHALLEPKITDPEAKDICIIYVRCKGIKAGSPAEAVVSLVDRYDETTGFRAMERLTGWHASIMAILAARGVVPRGAIPVERAAPGDVIVAEARLRGLEVQSEIHQR